VFVGNSDAGSVTSYRIGPTGALTLIGLFATSTLFGTLEDGLRADSLAVDPAGKLLFVAGGSPRQDTPDVLPPQVFPIEPSGVLTSIGVYSLSSTLVPPVLAVDPSSRFLFVAHGIDSDLGTALSVYDFSTFGPGSQLLVGEDFARGSPLGIAVDPAGQFVYIV